MGSHAVIVGAGPVGAVAAVLLARAGVGVTLIDRNATLSTASHASTFHPSTLDLLASLGISLHKQPDSVIVDAVQWRDNHGHLLAEIAYELVANLTAHPFRVHLDQQSLLDRLAELIGAASGIEFLTDTSVIELDRSRPGVAVVSDQGDRRWITADIIIGCDGSNSSIRRMAGIPFPVDEYPTTALRAHAQTDLEALLPLGAPRPMSALCYFRGGGDGLSALRMSTGTRLIVRTAPAKNDLTRIAEALTAATPWRVDQLEIAAIDDYRLHRGLVDSYLSNDAAVMVIGDAAHVTSTAGGLNMNSGIHDAFTLMPVVADWLHGKAEWSTLQNVAEARRNFVLQHVIPRTERRVRGLQDCDRGALDEHLNDIATLASDTAAARQFLIEASLLDGATNSSQPGLPVFRR